MSTTDMHSAITDGGMDPDVAAILRSLAPEEVDMLRDAFIYMDRDSDGYISKEEMMSKVAACVGPERFGPLQEYLVPLFQVADKDKDGRLSLTEFLMAFADGPGVVPAEVVNSCVADVRVRLTDEEVSALQDSFRRIDTNQDGVVDTDELEAALRAHLLTKFPDLTGENFKEIVAVVMASADTDRNGVLSLSEFIRSYQEDQGVLPATFLEPSADRPEVARQLTEDETTVLREAFAVLDRNDDGYVDVEDLYSALWDTLGSGIEDQNQIRDICDLIMLTADRSKRGHLTVTDFIRGFLLNVQIMQIPVAVAQERVRVACDKLQEMHDSGELEKLVMVFEDLDSDGDGYVVRSEMVNVLKSLFRDAFPGWDEDMLSSVMTAIVVGAETNSGGQLSLEEFIRSFVEGSGVLPPEAVQTWNSPPTTAVQPPPQSPSPPASADRERRLSTATDNDLARIGEAVRMLHAKEGKDGSITRDALHASIAQLYVDSPQHGEEMYYYALQQFVRPRGDGRLVWSENVKIEDVVDEAEGSNNRSNNNASSVDRSTGSARRPSMGSARRHRASISASVVELDQPMSYKERLASASASGPVAASSSAGVAVAAPASEGSAESAEHSFDGLKTQPQHVSASTPAPSAASSQKYAIQKPSAIDGLLAPHDASSTPYFDDDLKVQFDRYDTQHKGYLDRETFKKTYMQMEHFGLEPSQMEVDMRFRRYAHGSDKIYFNEFCILMLQRARM